MKGHIMFGFNKEKFEGFITEIKNDWAQVTVIDEKQKKSYMSVPVGDLKKRKIECKAGIIFLITLLSRPWLKKVRWVYSQIKRTPMSKEELDALLKYYEDKYGDV